MISPRNAASIRINKTFRQEPVIAKKGSNFAESSSKSNFRSNTKGYDNYDLAMEIKGFQSAFGTGFPLQSDN